ncbi:sensor histidine kinase [Ramlibacter sp.]|uniref:sensor histidine kinase n=1 Tax=Ramlibacter sp. TaxID=1917967 RepID=UPI003D09B168
MRIDWISKLQHLLQAIAFCLAIATLHYGFAPQQPYAPAVVFSLCIGITIWFVIDIGRHFFPSAAETGWPRGWIGFALVAAGIAAGFVVGRALGDLICPAMGLCTPGMRHNREADFRSTLLITVIAGLVGSYYFYSRSRSSYLERKMGETRRLADEARLKLLESQLEPHMLFNTLANLRALIGVDPQRAQRMLDHMIAYLRATLAASRAPRHTLRAEFDRLRDYLELMAVRMGPRLAYELHLPPELAQALVPTLVLQPLVENSIQHGLEPKVGGGRIDVRATAVGATLILEVTDTGVGAADAPTAGKGFGLTQIRERLATLYGSGASLSFDATPEAGARAIVTLPLQSS